MDRKYYSIVVMNTDIPHSSPWINESDTAAVLNVLSTKKIANGKLVREFESAVAQYLGFSNAWATVSGQAALVRSLISIGVKPRSDVIIPTYVCRAVSDAITAIGANPVVCDVDQDWCLSIRSVEQSISSNTAAIVLVHPFGIVANARALLKFGVPIVEDCCQSFSPHVGHEGALAIFSFHATKCLTTGEGGMVATSNCEIAEKIESQGDLYPPFASMSDLQAALGLSQLARYNEMTNWRLRTAERYSAANKKNRMTRLTAVWQRSMFFRFPLTVSEGYESVAPLFHARGVNVRRGVDSLLHRGLGMPDAKFPVATDLFNTTLSVPFYPALMEAQIETVERAMAEILI